MTDSPDVTAFMKGGQIFETLWPDNSQKERKCPIYKKVMISYDPAKGKIGTLIITPLSITENEIIICPLSPKEDKFEESIEISLNCVSDIYIGSSTFNHQYAYKYIDLEKTCFSLVYKDHSDSKTIHLKAPSTQIREQWLQGLKQFYHQKKKVKSLTQIEKAPAQTQPEAKVVTVSQSQFDTLLDRLDRLEKALERISVALESKASVAL